MANVNNYVTLAGNGTSQAAVGPTVLYAATVSTKGTTGNTLSLYDSASGASNLVAQIDTTVSTGTYFFKAQLKNGLFIQTATGVAGVVTVMWG